MLDGLPMGEFSDSVPQLEQLLRTKLHIPQTRSKHVLRPRLIARLNESLECKLTLISAPVGFGKTTLLSEWINRAEPRFPVAWVSLDEHDNDPVRFCAYVVAAIQTIVSDSMEDFGSAADLTHISSNDLLTALINTIVADVPYDFVLVLDDYHVITSQHVYEALAFILDHMPPHMHLVVSTRVDPPLPLAQLRARGQLVELRAGHLRFAIDEEITFLNQVMGLNLSTEEIVELDTRLEGWIAGMQLAALSMRDCEDVKDFIQAFTGTHRHIVDYLTEQVLLQLPPDCQSFLIETSILDRLTGPLCDAVTGNTGGRAMLEQLEAANLFIVPLDDVRNWYRYHHLFGDFLQSQLKAIQPDLAPTLHIRASMWYEQEMWITEAVYHSLAAEDIDRAIRLVSKNAMAKIREGELITVLEWMNALPDQAVRSSPRLCVDSAWALLLTGQTSAIESYLQDAEASLAGSKASRPGSASLLGEVTLIRLLFARLGDDPAHTIEQNKQALEQIDDSNLFGRGLLFFNLGVAYRKNRQVEEASRAFQEAIKQSQMAQNFIATMISVFNLAKLYEIQGQLFRAAETYQHILQTVHNGGIKPLRRSPALGAIYLGMADVLYEWNELKSAEQNLQEGIALGEAGGYLGMLLNGYTSLAQLKLAQGDPPGALDIIQKARQTIQRRNPHPTITEEIAAHQAKMQLAQGDLEAASRWAQRIESCTNIELDTLGEFKLIILARVLLAQGRCDESQHLLERLLQTAEADGRTGKVIELLTLQAMVRQACDDTVGALAALKQALILAEPEGYVRTFLDEGTPMAELLLLGSARNTWNEPRLITYVHKLLTCFGIEQADQQEIDRLRVQFVITEPLSERELQVLQLVAGGASNKEIAQKLSVTVSTVKAHLRNINSKLDVGSRTQAVARARSLHLLP